jgi:uncharacterized protein (TIGR02147 family)
MSSAKPRVYDFNDDRAYLQAAIAHWRLEGGAGRGAQSRLAEAAGCSPSFLSQALGGTVQLTPEHAFGIAASLGLDEGASEFLLLLVQHERAASAHYRTHLGKRIESLRRKQEDLAQRLPAARLGDGVDELLYYSSWVYAAIHIALSVPGLQEEAALAARFGIDGEIVARTLAELARMGLARREGNKWRLTNKFLHLPRQSPLARVNHMGWRIKAMENIQRGRDIPIQYTSVFSLARKDIPKVEEMLRRFIEDTREVIAQSPEEEVVCFLADLFTV